MLFLIFIILQKNLKQYITLIILHIEQSILLSTTFFVLFLRYNSDDPEDNWDGLSMLRRMSLTVMTAFRLAPPNQGYGTKVSANIFSGKLSAPDFYNKPGYSIESRSYITNNVLNCKDSI